MDLGSPISDLIPGVRGRVLAVLARLEAPVTVRALAAEAGASPQGTLDVVNDLVEAGLIETARVGSGLAVTLNRSHVLVPSLLDAVAARGTLIDRLVAQVGSLHQIAGGWLFGSAARGDGGRGSDVDVLLVASRSTEVEPWVQGIGRLRASVSSWTGNPLQVVEHTRSSWRALVDRNDALVRAVRSEGLALVPGSERLLRRSA